MKYTGYELYEVEHDGTEWFKSAYYPTEIGLESACEKAQAIAEEGSKYVATLRVYGVGHRRNGIRPMELVYEVPSRQA